MLKNYKNNKGFNHLCEVAGNEGIKRKGNAFFRIVGDGALQEMQYHWTKRPFYQEIVKIGLFSMYGELEPQWLTRLGCIPGYNYRYLPDHGVKPLVLTKGI